MRNTPGAFVALRVVVVVGAMVIGCSLVASPMKTPGAAAAARDLLCGFEGPGDDLVVGVPRYPSGGIVDIRPSADERRTLSLPYGTDEDRFGVAVEVVGLDGDGCNDLVVGAPGRGGLGAVYLFFSTTAGTGTGKRVRLPYAGSPGDGFGSSLAVEGRYWTPPGEKVVGNVRIWVGIPGRDVAGQADAGAVAFYTVSASGHVSGPRVFTQNSAGVPGRPEAGDRFGQVLAPVSSGVLIGQPGEDVGTKIDAGLVTVLPAPGATPTGPGPYVASEDSRGIPGAAEAGDRFGAALTDGRIFWVGVPGKDVGAIRDAGMVHQLVAFSGPSSFRSRRYLSQNSPGVPGINEPGDHFGASLQDEALFESCGDQVAIGAPDEDIGNVKDAGAVTAYTADETTEECMGSIVYDQGPAARAANRFGAALGFSNTNNEPTLSTLIVGIPGQDLDSFPDAGAVQTRSGSHEIATFTPPRVSVPGIRYGSVIARFALNYR
jgi:hypothetical protein